MKVLITGAAGNLGRHLGKDLVEHGHTVTGIDQTLRRDLPYRVRMVDMRVARDVFEAMEPGFDAVVHLANHTTHRSAAPHVVLSENLTMNAHVFDAAVAFDVKRIVFASSIQVVSGMVEFRPEKPTIRLKYLPVDSDAPAQPGNAYSLSKTLGEQMLEYHCNRTPGLSGVAIRYPWMLPKEWMHWATGSNFRGDPEEVHAFLLMEDAAVLTRKVLEADLPGFRRYFPAARENLARQSAAELIAGVYKDVPLRRPAGEIDSLVDVSRITAETGWAPAPSAYWTP